MIDFRCTTPLRPGGLMRAGALLIVLLGLVGCQAEQKQAASEATDGNQSAETGATADGGLLGTYWALVSLDGEPLTLDDEARRPFIQFPEADAGVRGYGGCNQFGGSYQLDGASIQFGPLASTKMFCTDTMAVEQGLFKALEQARRWQIADGQLEIYGAEGELLARFEAGAGGTKRN